MLNKPALLACLLWCLIEPGTVLADAARGKLLYENHCQSCHASTVHVRDKRKVTNPGELRAMITRWSGELKLNWQDADFADVYQHLNNRYYRFSTETGR